MCCIICIYICYYETRHSELELFKADAFFISLKKRERCQIAKTSKNDMVVVFVMHAPVCSV